MNYNAKGIKHSKRAHILTNFNTDIKEVTK